MTMATTNTNPPPGGWQVGSQVAATKRTATGQYVQGMTVHFVTGYGVSSTVWLPNATYTPANVKKAITAKVATLDAVANLSTSGRK